MRSARVSRAVVGCAQCALPRPPRLRHMARRNELLRALAELAAGDREDVLKLEVAGGDLHRLSGRDLPEPVDVVPVHDDNRSALLLEGTLRRGTRTPTAVNFELQWTP